MSTKKEMNIILAVVICLVFLGVLIFISINGKTNMGSNDTERVITDDFVSQGEEAKAGDTVAMNYTGRLEDGTVFDSNIDPNFGHTDPLEFTLGAGQMIPGFEKEILGMKVGEKKTFKIPPEEAYGAAGRPPVIPPNATLVFEVELLAIQNN